MGSPFTLQTPARRPAPGIAAIYQHLAAYPHLTVAENIFMGTRW